MQQHVPIHAGEVRSPAQPSAPRPPGRFPATALLFLALLAGLPAQEDEPGLSYTVTGTRFREESSRVPVQTQMVDENGITDSGAVNLEELLASLGVAQASGGMETMANLQGMGGERVLYLVDGRRLIGRVAGNLDGANLPLDSIERIEIVRGPQSALYGSDALGGVVNIITKKPGYKPALGLDARTTGLPVSKSRRDPPARSVLRRQDLALALDLPAGPLENRLGLSARRSFAYKDGGELSLYPETLGFSGQLETRAYPTDLSTLGLGGSYAFSRRDDTISAGGSYDRINTVRTDLSGLFEGETTMLSRYSFAAAWQRYGREKSSYNSLLDRTSDGGKETQDYLSADFGYSLAPGERTELSFFLSSAYDRLEKYNIAAGETNDRLLSALAVQISYTVDGRYAVSAGLRTEYSDDYGLFFAPKLSGQLYAVEGLRIMPSVGLGYRAPNFLELYLDSAGNVYHKFGNPDLRPEKSLGAMLAADWSASAFSAQASVYHNELFDEIAYDYTETYTEKGLHIIVKKNLKRSTRSGADFRAETSRKSGWGLGARYSYLFAWDRESESRMEDQSEHRAGAWVRWAAGARGPSVKLEADWASPHARRSDELLTLAIRGSLPVGRHLELYGGADNLTGAEDPYANLLAGPEVYLGLKARF